VSIKVTLEFNTQEDLVAFFTDKTTTKTPTVEKPAPAAKPEKVVDPKPEPAAATSAQEKVAVSTASSDAAETSPAMTEADLTKVVVATVARTSREQVLTMLQEKFGVTAGKQITDPAVRAQAKTALEAL